MQYSHNGDNDKIPDIDSVRAWLADWGREVGAVDFDRAEGRFSPDVVGFGTKATSAAGRDALRSEQWEQVWGAIDDFRFEADAAAVWVSPDRRMAVIGAAWTSLGRTAAGGRFPRNGRASVVLERTDPESPWIGVHTHFSREPDGPGTYSS